MQGKILGVERRRRWSAEAKARLVEETLVPGAVVSEVARRHGVSQSLLFTWRRQSRAEAPSESAGSILLPVEIESSAATTSDVHCRAAGGRRRRAAGTIEIELGSGKRVRVDNEVNADALRRVLSVLGER
jgi:transposase